MQVRNPLLGVVFKLVLVGLVAYGVVEAFVHPATQGVSPLRYFTVQSNLLVGAGCLFFILGGLSGRHVGRFEAVLRGALLLAISITGIIYHLLLAPAGGMSLASHVQHTIVPLGFLLDWLLFGSKGRFRLRDLPLWVAYPLAYLLLTLLAAAFDGFYPYPFMDASDLGYAGVALNGVVLLGVFLLLGAVYVGADRLLARSPMVDGGEAWLHLPGRRERAQGSPGPAEHRPGEGLERERIEEA